MKKLLTWVRSNPVIFACHIAWSAACGAVMAAGHIALGAYLLALAYTALCISLNRHAKRLLCVALCMSMCAVPRQAQGVQYALGGVVLLVACGVSYIGCRAINCAKRVARPASTNAAPEEFRVAGEDCEFAAGFFWGSECYVERRQTGPPVPVRFTLNILVGETNCTVAMEAARGSQFVETLDEFKEELNANGLSMPVAPVASESYSRNRQPVAAEQVPISFNHQTHVARIGKGGVMVRVEASEDLAHWRPLMALDVAVGQRIGISDATESGAQFYRVTTGH